MPEHLKTHRLQTFQGSYRRSSSLRSVESPLATYPVITSTDLLNQQITFSNIQSIARKCTSFARSSQKFVFCSHCKVPKAAPAPFPQLSPTKQPDINDQHISPRSNLLPNSARMGYHILIIRSMLQVVPEQSSVTAPLPAHTRRATSKRAAWRW